MCFSISTCLCPLGSLLPIICHCPAHIIIGRAIQWNMPFGAAELLCFDAASFDAKMTARRWCLLLTANEGVTLRVTIIYWIARNKPGNDGGGGGGVIVLSRVA
ncbi:hypothetical protein [Candidatus Spongiihabitans sp.]|uniref:hypothetical protein n=1 Tax=Candidatus Spongiihabitans sp. TaxID=3101308 RepID=UPI003C7D803B